MKTLFCVFPFVRSRDFVVPAQRKSDGDASRCWTNHRKALTWGAIFLAFSLSGARASMVTLPLDFVFSGATPAGSSPWLSLTLQDGLAPNSVRLTLDGSGLSGTEFVSNWYVNLNPAFSASALSFSVVPNAGIGFTSVNIDTGVNVFKADGDGYYDLRFNFQTSGGSGRFAAGDTPLVVDVTGSGGLTVADFLYESVNGIPGTGVYYTAGHIQGVGSSSAWVGTNALPTAAIPEPSAYATALGGVALLGALLRRRWLGGV